MIYLASPYTYHDGSPAHRQGRTQGRVNIATNFEVELLNAGLCVYNAIRMGHGIWDAVHEEFDWYEYSDRIVRICSAVVVLQQEGWRRSHGVAAEINVAKACGIPVRYADPTALLHFPLIRELRAIDAGESTGGQL